MSAWTITSIGELRVTNRGWLPPGRGHRGSDF